ncbi:hypothetical protein SNEBB_010839 [Seison nebaliae]|nr:hypothetical protein SNEBB_010839 [Seison nebaliae]
MTEENRMLRQGSRIAVIGGGAAGLITSKLLRDIGNFNVKIYEQNDKFGGTWLYDNHDDGLEKNITLKNFENLSISQQMNEMENCQFHSSMYESLRTNLPKQIMSYMNEPFPASISSFPHHSDVQKYLVDFGYRHKLDELTNFNRSVQQIDYVDKNGNELSKEMAKEIQQNFSSSRVGNLQNFLNSSTKFSLKSTSNLKENFKEYFDAIILCNGHYSHPYFSEIKNLKSFKGKIFHSHFYRNARQFYGKRIVIIGGASSGVDIAKELNESKIFEKIYLSNSKFKLENILPISRVTEIVNSGNGILTDKNEIIDDIDLLLFCTGYNLNFPMLSTIWSLFESTELMKEMIEMYETIVKSCSTIKSYNSKRVLYPLNNNLLHMFDQRLAFIGLPSLIIPLPLMELQSRYLTCYWKQSLDKLTSLQEIKKQLFDELTQYGNGISPHKLHKFGDRQFAYNQSLSNKTIEMIRNSESISKQKKEIFIQQTLIPTYVEEIYQFVHNLRSNNVNNYREYEFLIDNLTKKWDYYTRS